jgi:hypothetical protein
MLVNKSSAANVGFAVNNVALKVFLLSHVNHHSTHVPDIHTTITTSKVCNRNEQRLSKVQSSCMIPNLDILRIDLRKQLCVTQKCPEKDQTWAF